jgi:hypothetical protein
VNSRSAIAKVLLQIIARSEVPLFSRELANFYNLEVARLKSNLKPLRRSDVDSLLTENPAVSRSEEGRWILSPAWMAQDLGTGELLAIPFHSGLRGRFGTN